MKNKFILKVASLGIVSFASVAFANDGIINFEGALTASTCTVTVDGVASPATVILPTVSTALLQTAGETTGRTGFNIELSDCNGVTTTSAASAFFENGPTVNTTTFNLKNSGDADLVELQLLDVDGGDVIKIGNTSQKNSTSKISLATGSASLPYAVQYYALGPTLPGSVVSSVNFTIDYD